MGNQDERRTPPNPLGANDWDDWDPSNAHNGYTGKARALRDIALPRDPALEQPTPLFPPLPRSAPPPGAGLSPAAQAILARASSESYLTITHDVMEPGFAEVYDAVLRPEWSAPFGRLLLSMFLTLPRSTGWQVLDVGCGAGYPTLELARFLGQASDIAGIDVWDEAIAIARRKANDQWLRNVSFLVADIMASGLPDASFDTITCNLGLASFADRAGALAQMRRLLRPGGQLLLTTPLQSAMREFLDIYYLTLRDLKLEGAVRELTQMIAARPTVASVQRLLEDAGFTVKRAATESFTLRYPSPQAFFGSLLIQTTYLESWRSVIEDETVRGLVFHELERRLAARAYLTGGAGSELTLTVPMLCAHAVRV
jgi:ubiquinone/menaquinone biosynthesis C-methylase UbiE